MFYSRYSLFIGSAVALLLRCILLGFGWMVSGCSNPESVVNGTTLKGANAGKVYFVCRSEYEVPLGHRIVEFNDGSLLNWFQNHWLRDELWTAASQPSQTGSWVPADKPESEWKVDDVIPIYDRKAVSEYFDELLQGGIYGINAFWEAMAEWGENPPRTTHELEEFVRSINYYGTVAFEQGAVQIQTDDDEIELALYMFDEAYAKAHPHRTSFLIRDDWRLPVVAGTEGKNLDIPSVKDLNDTEGVASKGAVYCAFLSSHDGMTLLDITGCFRFSGVRLPEFGEFLVSQALPLKDTSWGGQRPLWPEELILTKALVSIAPKPTLGHLLNSTPSNVLARLWSNPGAVSNLSYSKKQPRFLSGTIDTITSDFEELEAYLAKQESESRSVWKHTMQDPFIQVSDHMCQIRFYDRVTAREGSDFDPFSYLSSYIFFDDLWVAANPDLAESILHYGGRWDCLYEVKNQ